MVLYCTPLAKNTSKLRVLVGFQKIRPVFRSAPGAPWEIHVHGRSSRELFGEIGLSEFRIVFAEVFICPETMKLHPESLRETHFEATATYFEFPKQIGRKSRMRQSSPRNPFRACQGNPGGPARNGQCLPQANKFAVGFRAAAKPM